MLQNHPFLVPNAITLNETFSIPTLLRYISYIRYKAWEIETTTYIRDLGDIPNF